MHHRSIGFQREHPTVLSLAFRLATSSKVEGKKCDPPHQDLKGAPSLVVKPVFQAGSWLNHHAGLSGPHNYAKHPSINGMT